MHMWLHGRYPQPVMDKVKEMSEGITVTGTCVHKTRGEIVGKGKRPSAAGEIVCVIFIELKGP